MIGTEKQKEIIGKVEAMLGQSIVEVRKPKQGMGSSVILVRDEAGKEYAVKTGEDVGCDLLALNLIARSGIDIPVPKVFGCFDVPEGKTLIMERIKYPLLEEVPREAMGEIIPSMLENLKKIHLIKSSQSGALTVPAQSWKEFLLYKFSGNHPWFDWRKIVLRDGVDAGLVESSIIRVSGMIEEADIPEGEYSLLHTDFNQRNLFADPATHRITSIIDWSEAAFGDPLYDFARAHMFILHFDLGEEVEKKYFQALNLTEEDRRREDLYLESQILDYIAWYSEKKNNFNAGRLKLHQDFLRRRSG